MSQPWERRTTSGDVTELFDRVKRLEAATGASLDGPWITVGTPTQVAGLVDPYGTLLTDLIAANPAPFNASPWVPYNDPWLYSGGLDAPVAFMLDASGFTVIRGAASGGGRTTSVFDLPVGFRAFYQQELLLPVGNNEFVATVVAGTDGSLVWIDTI